MSASGLVPDCCLCALPMGAGAEAADPALSAMVQRALKLADIMQECAQSEAYCSLYAGSAEIGARRAAMGEGPYDAPVSGALLTLSPAAMDRLLQFGDSAPALSEGIRQKIYASLPVTLCTMQVSRAGAMALAASSMLSCGDCAVMAADMPQAAVLSLSFGGAYDGAVRLLYQRKRRDPGKRYVWWRRKTTCFPAPSWLSFWTMRPRCAR